MESSVSQSLAIVSWNIENLEPALRYQAEPRSSGRTPKRPKKTVPELLDMVERLGNPDILCLQEIRIRPRDTATVAAMVSALPGYR
jgi:exonuclease III